MIDYLATKTPRLQAIGLTRSAPAADELVQAAAVQALEKWAKFDGTRALGPWFWYVMLNLHRAGRVKAGKTLSLDAPLGAADDEDGVTHADLLVSDVPLLETAALEAREEAALSERTRVALASVRTRERMALIAKDLRGLDWEDVAAAFGYSVGNMRLIVADGRAQFRSVYAALETLA